MIRITALHVHPKPGTDLIDETTWHVAIHTEGAGEFVRVESLASTVNEPLPIAINPEEWPALRRAINRMVRECRP